MLLPDCASARHPSIQAEERARKIAVFPLPVRHPDCTNRNAMRSTLVVLALILLAGLAILSRRILTARAASGSGTQPVAATSCVDRYNGLLKNAKEALIAGDRSTTVGLLQEAQRVIAVCPALRDLGSPQISLFAENVRDSNFLPTINKLCCFCSA